jgi:hypothetical protein
MFKMKKRVMTFDVVYKTDLCEFKAEVTKRLAEGWHLILGGFQVTRGGVGARCGFYQTMFKYIAEARS